MTSPNPIAVLVDRLPEIVASWDGNGRTTYLNQSGRLRWALSEGDPADLPSCEQWYPDAVARMIKHVALPAATRDGRWQGLVTLRDGSGRERRALQVIFPVRSGDGALVGFSTIIRDGTTPEKEAFEEMAQDEVFSRLFRSSPYVAILTDVADRRIVEVSDRLCVFFGETRESLINDVNGHETWVDPAECERVYQDLERAGAVYDREVRFYGRGREIRVGLFSGVIIEFRGRRCVHAVFEDLTELSRAEEALQESEERFSKAFYASPDPYIIADAQTHAMLEVNDAYCLRFGVTRAEAVGRKNSDLDLWADLSDRDRFVEALDRDGEVHEMEQRRRTRSGETVVCRVTAFRTEIGGRRCAMYRLRDITHERQAEQALRESEEKFSKAFHASPDPISIAEFPTGRITEVNDAFCRLFDYSREQLLGSGDGAAALWADRHDRDRYLACLAGKGTVPAMETEMVKRTGRRIACRITANRLEIDGRPLVVTRLTDITEQRQALRALRESEAKFYTVFHASPDSVAISTLADGRIIEITDGFTRLHGWSRQEAIGRTVEQLGLWADPAERDMLLKRLRDGRPIHSERVVARDRNGGLYHCLYSAVTIEIAGQPCRMSVVRDITERQRLEEQLRQAQKMESIGQLAGGVAHDFNNILTVIQGHTSFLLEDRALAPSVRSALQQIRQSATLAADLTRQLLVFGRRQAIQPGPLQMAEVVDRVARLLDRVIGENIVLDVVMPEGLPLVNADSAMMEQVLLNLALNARDAMPGGGHIAITGRSVIADDAYVRRMPQARRGRFAGLRVSDTGEGIAPDILPRIFDPFFTTKQQGKGTGLGLATVYSVIQQHGGWIDVESERGRGTTFTAWFPVADVPAGAAPKPRAPIPAAVRGNETILVVEDKEEVRSVLRAVLRRLGYRVVMADNGPDALARWPEHRDEVALLFTDVMMPGGLTGKDLAERLRAERPELKVVYCTGYDANILDAATLQAKGTRFLTKPFDVVGLAAVVRELLDAK